MYSTAPMLLALYQDYSMSLSPITMHVYKKNNNNNNQIHHIKGEMSNCLTLLSLASAPPVNTKTKQNSL